MKIKYWFRIVMFIRGLLDLLEDILNDKDKEDSGS